MRPRPSAEPQRISDHKHDVRSATTDKSALRLCDPPTLLAYSVLMSCSFMLINVVESAMALCFVAASVATTRQVQDMMTLVSSLPRGETESSSIAMGALVALDREMRAVKTDWGIAVTMYFATMFAKSLYYMLTVTLKIDEGVLACAPC